MLCELAPTLPERPQDLLECEFPTVRGWPAALGKAPSASRTRDGQSGASVLPNPLKHQEQPVVVPQVMHFKHVPLRTMVNWPQSPQGSPS